MPKLEEGLSRRCQASSSQADAVPVCPEKRRGGDSEGNEAWPEVDFDSDMIYWGGDRVATSPEIAWPLSGY